MEAVGTTHRGRSVSSSLSVNTQKQVVALTEDEKLLLSPVGRRNKMRIEGHRGLGRYAAENTLESFARSADEQLDGIELDVWLTKDKFPVVNHTHCVAGVSGYITFDDGTEMPVYEMTFEELRAKTILKGNVVPLLDEVFNITKNKICVNVEFKGEDLNGALEVLKLCVKYDNLEQVHFSSFNWKFAEALDKARKELNIAARQPFGFLTETMDVSEVFTIGKFGDGVTFGYSLIHENTEKFKEVSKEIIKNGFLVKVYFSFRHTEIFTDYDLLDACCIDTVITNEPFLMKSYFQNQKVSANA
jgi:glycerophosphoryl diester phosphodiesterase